MKMYVGKKCPYCQTTFEETDDIVICNTCEMPHHKDCWADNKGCTTFGCTGTIKGVDTANNDTSTGDGPKYTTRNQGNNFDTLYCASCGTAVLQGDSFCRNCGAPVRENATVHSTNNRGGQVASAIGEWSNLLKEHFKTRDELDMELPYYIGDKAEYYMPTFGRLKLGKKYFSWNWFSFLLAPFWCAYRKMYIPAGIITAVNLIMIAIGGLLGGILNLIIYACVGAFGNYLYMYDLEQRIEKGKGLDSVQKTIYMEKCKSVSLPAAAIYFFIFLLMVLLIIR